MSEFADILAYDWAIRDGSRVLHHVAEITNADTADTDWYAIGRTSCGQEGEWSIPGISARMAMPRCDACCDATDFPRGIGSPKNDDACRALLSLPPQT
jgi:hypothetical protein